jgi:hypothetical protein
VTLAHGSAGGGAAGAVAVPVSPVVMGRTNPELSNLPKRRRKSLGSPAVERYRLYYGAAGLARLGYSLVALPTHSYKAIGVVLEWCHPWFVVAYSDGTQ